MSLSSGLFDDAILINPELIFNSVVFLTRRGKLPVCDWRGPAD